MDFTSEYAKKLFVVASLFGLAFVGESIVLFLSVLLSDAFRHHFDAFNGVYFALDLCALATVLLLFRKSVSDATNAVLLVQKPEKSRVDSVGSRIGSKESKQSFASLNSGSRQPGHRHTKS